MELDHQHDLVPLLKNLYDISYKSAKDLLHEIASLEMETSLKLFWRLACILYDDDQDELQNNFNEWIHEAIRDIVPKESECHPFIHALFLNDTEKLIKAANKINPYLALIFDSPTKKIEIAKKVPSILKDKNFKYGENTIPGAAVWALIMGDVSQILTLKLPWVLLFTLHYWNSDESISSSLLTAFQSFCDTNKFIIQDNEQDPIFLLLKYYSIDHATNSADKKLADVASLLPPLDMFFFLKMFKAMDHNVSENSISLALNIAEYQLIQMDCLEETVDILNNHTKDSSQEILQLAQYVASPEDQLTKIEKYMIKSCPDVLNKRYMYLFKGNKTQILQEEFNSNKSLDYAGRATDFFLEAAGISQIKQAASSTNSYTDSTTNSTNSNSNSNDSNDSDQSTNDSNSNGFNVDDSNNNDFESDDFDQEEIDPENLQIANYQAYNVYLVKAMMKGEGLNKLFQWSGKFAKYPDMADISDGTQIYKIFEAIKVAEKGEVVDQSLLETIADEIKLNTKLYTRFRYYVASQFYKQPNGFALFSENEMTPKEKLLEIYEDAFQ